MILELASGLTIINKLINLNQQLLEKNFNKLKNQKYNQNTI